MKTYYKQLLICLLFFTIFLPGCEKKTTFKDAKTFNCGLAAVKINGKYGFINTTGEIKINPSYDDTYNFFNDIAIVNKDGNWGAINKNGDILLPFEFSSLYSMNSSNTLFSATKDDVDSCITIDNKLIFSSPSKEPLSFYPREDDNFIITYTDGYKYGYLNLNTEFNSNCIYDSISINHNSDVLSFSYLTDTHTEYGFTNLDTKKTFNNISDSPLNFTGDISTISKGTKKGIIDKNGTILADTIYTLTLPNQFNMSSLELDNKWGCINGNGDIVLDFIYDSPPIFYSKTSANTYLNGKNVSINLNGTITDIPKYGECNFSNGDLNQTNEFCSIKYEDDEGKSSYMVLDSQGEIILTCQCDDLIFSNTRYTPISRLGRHGCIDNRGIEIIPVIYDDLCCLYPYDDIFVITQNKKMGLINKDNQIILPCEYNSINIYDFNVDKYGNTSIISPYIVLETEGKFDLFNIEKKSFLKLNCSQIGEVYTADSPRPCCRDGEWFYINEDGKVCF